MREWEIIYGNEKNSISGRTEGPGMRDRVPDPFCICVLLRDVPFSAGELSSSGQSGHCSREIAAEPVF